MPYRCIYGLLLLTALLSLPAKAQDGLRTPLLDPSRAGFVNLPEPAIQTNLQAISVNNSLYTGALQVALPLYTLQLHDLKLPIGLQYISNGLKVDALPGTLGMSWNISAGGSIHRSVRGKPDEMISSELISRETLSPEDYAPFEMRMTNEPSKREETQRISWYGIWFKEHDDPAALKDQEPDVFTFQAGGISGSFYLHPDTRKPVVSCDADLKITYALDTITNSLSGKPDSYRFSWFEVTVPMGTKYIFRDILSESSVFYYDVAVGVYRKDADAGPELDHYANRRIETGKYATNWYLSEICSIHGDTLSFTYTPDREAEIWQSSQLSATFPVGAMYGEDLQFVPPGQTENTQEILFSASKCVSSPLLLSAIRAGGYKVEFSYVKNQIEGSYYSSLLEEMKVSYNGRFIQRYRLDYAYYIAQRDRIASWCFGGDGQSFTDVYSSEIFSLKEGITYRPFLQSVTQYDSLGHHLQPVKFEYISPELLPARLTYRQNFYGFFTDYQDPGEMLVDYNDSLPAVVYNENPGRSYSKQELERGLALRFMHPFSQEPPVAKPALGVLKRIVFPKGGYQVFEYDERPYGALLAKTSLHDGDTVVSTKEYSYEKGAVPRHPRRKIISSLGGTYLTLAGKANGELLLKGGNFVGFKEVTERLMGGERTVYTFKTAADQDNPVYDGFAPEIKPSDYDLARGWLTGVKKYGTAGNIIEEKEYVAELLQNYSAEKYEVCYADNDQLKYYMNQFTRRPVSQNERNYYGEGEFTEAKQVVEYSGENPFCISSQHVYTKLDTTSTSYGYSFEDPGFAGLTKRNVVLPLWEETRRNGLLVGGQKFLYQVNESWHPNPYEVRRIDVFNGREYEAVFWGEAWDDHGKVLRYRTKEEPGVRIKYDSLGYPVRLEKGSFTGSSADTHWTSTEYGLPGQVIRFKESNALEKVYQYDGFGRLVRVLDEDGYMLQEQVYRDADMGEDALGIGSMQIGETFTVGRNDSTGMQGNASLITHSFKTTVRPGTKGLTSKGLYTTLSWVDGLGRSIQELVVGGNANGSNRLSFSEYDYLGRQQRVFKSLQMEAGKGEIVKDPLGLLLAQNPDEVPWAEKRFDEYGRLVEQGGLGKEFQPGSGHTVQYEYAMYKDDLMVFEYHRDTREYHRKNYPEGTVLVQLQQAFGKTVKTYTALNGLKLKEELLSDTLVMETLYVYDEYWNLTAIIPPIAAGDIEKEEYVYRYFYDERNRLVEKQIPGAGMTRYTWDEKDRITEVENSAGETTWITYDAFNRPVEKGILVDGVKQTLIRTFYDRHEGVSGDMPEGAVESNTGRMTGQSVRVLGTDKWENYHWFYDAKGRVLEERIQRFNRNVDRKSYHYSFDGRLLEEKHQLLTGADILNIHQEYEYYDNGQLRRIRQSINDAEPVILASYEYDERGQMVAKNQGGKFRTSYSWNYQGWLESIVSEDRFRQEMYYYDLPEDSGAEARWDGNIASLMHSVDGDELRFDIGYDPLNRLLAVTHKGDGSGGSQYGTAYAYDKAGNIQSLLREHVNHSMETEALNELAYTYEGNHLHEVERLNEKKVEVWPGGECLPCGWGFAGAADIRFRG